MRHTDGPMYRVLLLLFATFCVSVGGVASVHGQPEPSSGPSVKWQHGPSIAMLGGIAELRLPGGYSFVEGQGARRVLEATENIPSGKEQGLVLGPDQNWFVVFEFDEIGYVRDDEKDRLDADAMLESIKRGTDLANEERRRRGWGTMTVIGWDQPPRYDPVTHNLEWAIRGKSENHLVVNYNTRLLGRKGVMRVTLVGDPSSLTSILPNFKKLLTGFEFTSGNRYAEFVQGDNVAKYGLTALVVGGAAAVAAKTGLFKYVWKVLVFIGIGFLIFLKRLFSRKDTVA